MTDRRGPASETPRLLTNRLLAVGALCLFCTGASVGEGPGQQGDTKPASGPIDLNHPRDSQEGSRRLATDANSLQPNTDLLWRGELEEGEVAKKAWRHLDAEKHFLAAIEIAKSGPSEQLRLAKSYVAIGDLYVEMANFLEGDVLLRRALRIREKLLGPDGIELVEVLDKLALLNMTAVTSEFTMRRRHDFEAKGFYERSLAIREKALGPNHPDVAAGLEKLAQVLPYAGGDEQEAKSLARRALAIREAALGPDHPDVAKSLGALAGRLYLGRNPQEEEAEMLYRRALAIGRRSGDADLNALADSLTNLTLFYLNEKRFDEATPLCEELFAVVERFGPARGREDPFWDMAVCIWVHRAQERNTEAERVTARQLKAEEKAYGSDSPRLARALLLHAGSLRRLGRTSEAEGYFRRALAASERSGIPETWTLIANKLAKLLREGGRDQEAEQIEARVAALERTRVRKAMEGLAALDADVRSAAAWMLADIGTSAKDAQPRLRELLTDEDTRVREAAKLALSVVVPQEITN